MFQTACVLKTISQTAHTQSSTHHWQWSIFCSEEPNQRRGGSREGWGVVKGWGEVWSREGCGVVKGRVGCYQCDQKGKKLYGINKHWLTATSSYLWCCPLHWNLSSVGDVVIIICYITGHPKVANLMINVQSYTTPHHAAHFQMTLHTKSSDTRMFLAARSLCTNAFLDRYSIPCATSTQNLSSSDGHLACSSELRGCRLLMLRIPINQCDSYKPPLV